MTGGKLYPLEGRPLTCNLISELIRLFTTSHGQMPDVVKVNPMSIRGEPIPKAVDGVPVRQNGSVFPDEVLLEGMS